jgi:hypothetical protein
MAEQTVWELQEQLRTCHTQEYKKAYPDSEFVTGRTLPSHGKRAWDDLTPEEREREERIAYRLKRARFEVAWFTRTPDKHAGV